MFVRKGKNNDLEGLCSERKRDFFFWEYPWLGCLSGLECPLGLLVEKVGERHLAPPSVQTEVHEEGERLDEDRCSLRRNLAAYLRCIP